MSEYRQPTPEPTEDQLREWLDALPPTSDGAQITWRVATAALFGLRRRDSTIPEHLRNQNSSIFDTVEADLEPVPGTNDTYVITADELRGIIARATTLAAMQATLQIGQNLTARSVEIRELAALYDLPPVVEDTADSEPPNHPDADSPPAA